MHAYKYKTQEQILSSYHSSVVKVQAAFQVGLHRAGGILPPPLVPVKTWQRRNCRCLPIRHRPVRPTSTFTLVSDAISVSVKLSVIFPFWGRDHACFTVRTELYSSKPACQEANLEYCPYPCAVHLSSRVNDLNHLLIRQKYSKI